MLKISGEWQNSAVKQFFLTTFFFSSDKFLITKKQFCTSAPSLDSSSTPDPLIDLLYKYIRYHEALKQCFMKKKWLAGLLVLVWVSFSSLGKTRGCDLFSFLEYSCAMP